MLKNKTINTFPWENGWAEDSPMNVLKQNNWDCGTDFSKFTDHYTFLHTV